MLVNLKAMICILTSLFSHCWANEKLRCSTICGVVCSDGIVLGTEKIVINKMMLSGTDKRTFNITREVGCVSDEPDLLWNTDRVSIHVSPSSINFSLISAGREWTCAWWQGSDVQRQGRSVTVWEDVWNQNPRLCSLRQTGYASIDENNLC